MRSINGAKWNYGCQLGTKGVTCKWCQILKVIGLFLTIIICWSYTENAWKCIMLSHHYTTITPCMNQHSWENNVSYLHNLSLFKQYLFFHDSVIYLVANSPNNIGAIHVIIIINYIGLDFSLTLGISCLTCAATV